MSDENQPLPEGVKEFLQILEEGRKKFHAVETFTKIMLLVLDESGETSDEARMEKVLDILIQFGEESVMRSMEK